jgi:flagellar assembly protein FliH
MKSLSNIIKYDEECGKNKQVDIFFSEDRFTPPHDSKSGLHAQMREVRHKAENEAQEILNNAKKQAVQEVQHGFEEGIQKGLLLVHPLQAALQAMSSELKEFMTSHGKCLEPHLVNMVLAISQKVIKSALESDKEVVVRTVNDALCHLIDKEQITVRVNSQDFQLMKQFEPQLLETFTDIRQITIAEDASVGRGGCIIETLQGTIDATIEKQYERIRELMSADQSYTPEVP